VTGLRTACAVLGLAGAAFAVPAQPLDAAAQAGQRKAQSCAVCHGPLGISSRPDDPHLAAQPVLYLVEQLRAYRSGKRHHEIMSVIAKPLTDQDIDELAAWYAAIRVEAVAPN
jgi:cytochrome c553